MPPLIGYFVNGARFASWSDIVSYKSEKVWFNLAVQFEQYDLDVCLGHAQQDGEYHRK